MRRNRRFSVLLFLLLPLALWSLSGWSPVATRYDVPTSPRPNDPDPVIQQILDQVTQTEFSDIDGGLSGEHPVTIGGQQYTLTSRYTPSSQGTLAEQYVYEYFQTLGYSPTYQNWSRCSLTGRNVVVEVPGTVDPTRIYLLTGHLDSISPNPTTNAKGADDNGSGTTAVMMAARILGNYHFDYTVRFVAFTGEERGLCGSNAYAAQSRTLNENIQGVINLDMIAFDSNNVKDVEIHAGTRADSQAIANVFVNSIGTYGLNLVPHVLTSSATNRSDHASFWTYNYPAFLGIEYFFGGDGNPWYHSYTCCDTMSHADLGMAQDMTKAALATLAQLAVVHEGPPPSATPAPPTSTPTETPVPPMGTAIPTNTGTPVPPTGTAIPTNTDTPVPPTETPAPPTETPVIPSETAVPPTSTPTGSVPTATATVCAMNFSDVDPSNPFYNQIRYLFCMGAISGYSDGTFRPFNTTTRGQVSKIVVLAEGWPISTPTGGSTFTDVSPGSAFFDYVETAYAHAIVSGYADQTFRPGENVTRGQLSKIVVLAEGWTPHCDVQADFTDVPATNPFFCYIEAIYLHAPRGIITGYGDGTFRPYNPATRGQISKIIVGAITAP